MDIPELSMALSMSKVQSDWGTAMLSKSLDNLSEVGATVAEMMDTSAMELSVNPDIGGNIDLKV
ncbi:MAG: putative motility protein [Butyrivibrio sp.]|uniref:YjfB family protein n=1 Tax=Butyrivibrio sp. NC2002 TaxID=1410610 RepID=UPI00055AD827|nr:YjfB family protein [Butyrivibrio sp. NC2002]MBE5858590.1 putative motility protein [Butyrivibrio sp.]